MGARSGSLGGGGNWAERPAGAAEDELGFEAAQDRLPWLESDGDDEEPVAYDTGRLLGLAAAMLGLLALLLGGIWFFANRADGDEPVPDGSLIAAPAAPYKVRPPSPGGKTFAGTGDTSYAVGEGREIEGRLAAAETPAPPPVELATAPAAMPSASPTATATGAGAPTPKPTPKPEASERSDAGLPRGTAVQVGAYSTRADAEAGWKRLTGQTEALSGVSYRIVSGRADIGTVYRLQAAGGDARSAQALCARLKTVGIACQVK